MQSKRRILLLSVAFLGATAYFLVSLWRQFAFQEPWDFAINWTAAQSLRRGLSLYSPDDLRNLGQLLIGPGMFDMFRNPFSSYIGPPSTALLLLPFTLVSFPVALILYRIGLIIAFGISVFLIGLALPPPQRTTAWQLGALALLLFQPVVLSIQLGQVDAWVMVGLALSLWALSRGRWGLVGIGLGFAALLKISPILLIFYLLLRGKRQAVISAVVTIVFLLSAAALIGRANDLWIFAHDIVPSLSAGSLHIQNQSLPGWLARLLLPGNDLMSYTRGLGGLSVFGVLIAFSGILVLYWKRRNNEVSILDFGLLIFIALLAGPITWDHYFTWAILPGMLFVSMIIWSDWLGRRKILVFCCLSLGTVLLMLPTFYFSEAAISGNWALRLATGTKTFGLLLWLIIFGSYVLAGWANISQGNISRNRYRNEGIEVGEIA